MRFSPTRPRRLYLLAVLTALVICDVSLAGPRGRGIGGWRYNTNYNYNPVRDLGTDIGAFSGPYRGGYAPYYPYYNPYYSGGFYLGDGYVPSYPATPPITDQRSYYPPQQPAAPAPTAPAPVTSATATIDLYVPANAEVWLNGQRTNQTGTVRRFVTPPLNPNAHSSYDLRVRYTGQDGKEVDETRHVAVEPGRQVVLNLQPAPKN